MVLFRGRQLAPLLALSHRGVFEHWLSRPYHLARTATLTTMSALDSPSDTASPGAPMLQYADLAATMRAIEEEPARLEKEALMASLLSRAWSLSSDELLACVALATLQLEPSARPLKLGIGDAMVLAAIAEASGAPLETLKAELVHHGDVGILAEERLQGGGGGGGGGVGGKSMPSWTPLTMTEAQAQLLALSSLSGKGKSLTLAHFSRPFFPPMFSQRTFVRIVLNRCFWIGGDARTGAAVRVVRLPRVRAAVDCGAGKKSAAPLFPICGDPISPLCQKSNSFFE